MFTSAMLVEVGWKKGGESLKAESRQRGLVRIFSNKVPEAVRVYFKRLNDVSNMPLYS